MRSLFIVVLVSFFALALSCGEIAARELAGAPSAIIRTGSGEATEMWRGSALTASFRAGMCFSANGGARGVLLLKHANGQEDTYHLYGRVKNNAFELSHSSGHVLTGKLVGPSRMEGQARLKNGLKLSLKGERILDAPLLAEDCAPLPEK